MTTIATLAAEYNSQPYEVAAALDLGTNYHDHDELDDATEREYREVLDIIKAQREDQK